MERLGASAACDIVAPVRSYRTCAQVARFPISMPRVDLLDYEQVRKSVAGARFVFHLAYGRDGPQQERVTIEGTRNVVEAAIETGAEAVVVLSTIYVFGQPPAEVDEAWPYRPVGGVYGTSKALMERWCMHRAQGSGHTRIVVLNASCVYGPGGDAYTALPVRLATEGGFCWINDGRGAANYTYVENLVDAMLLAATSRVKRTGEGSSSTMAQPRGGLPRPAAGRHRRTRYRRTRPRELRELHRRRHRPNLVDVARIAMSDQSVRTALRETRVGEAMLWGAEHATPAVMARMRRGWHWRVPQFRRAQSHRNTTAPAPQANLAARLAGGALRPGSDGVSFRCRARRAGMGAAGEPRAGHARDAGLGRRERVKVAFVSYRRATAEGDGGNHRTYQILRDLQAEFGCENVTPHLAGGRGLLARVLAIHAGQDVSHAFVNGWRA